MLRNIDPPAGVDDRRITGAAAQIARQPAAHRRLVEFLAILQQSGHRDHKTGRAEPALRAVAVDHRLLHRARLGFAAQSLDRHDVRTVQLKHKLDARINGPINEPLAIFCRPPDKHRARPTIALAANDLGAYEAVRPANVIRQRKKNVAPGHFVAATIQPK